MKNILSILFLFAFALCSFGQERTVDMGSGTTTSTKLVNLNLTKTVAYNGGASDYLLPTTRDTIDFVVAIDPSYKLGPINYNVAVTLAPIAGADTTVSVTILGKKTAGATYGVLKAAALTSAVTSELIYEATSLGNINAADTVGMKYYTSFKGNTLLYYRYIKARLIIKGNDSVGTGIKVKRVEFQFD